MHHAPQPEHHDAPGPGSGQSHSPCHSHSHCPCQGCYHGRCPCAQAATPPEHEHPGGAHKHPAFEAALHSIDPASVPTTEGVVGRFLYNLHGDADGFLLDGTQVHFAPHLSEALTQAVLPGDRVLVQGLKRRGVDVLLALSITALKGKQTFDCAPAH